MSPEGKIISDMNERERGEIEKELEYLFDKKLEKKGRRKN